jgi:hypothetical protein
MFMYKKWSNIFLYSILCCNSTGALASLLLGPDLLGYSAVSGAALNVAANSTVTNDLVARAAVGIGASSSTANIHAGAAVATGASSNSGNVYAGHAAVIGANASAKNIYAGHAAGIGANASANNIYAGAAVVLGAGASAANIYAAAAITLGADSSAENIYAVAAITGSGAQNSTAGANTVPIINSYREIYNIEKAIEQIVSAQGALFGLAHDFELGVGIANTVFDPGVYKGTALNIAAASTIQFDGKGAENPFWIFNLSSALTVGAANKFEIINAGAGASVIWNLGGALGIGAGSSFLGTAFVTGAAVGATSAISCGNLFTTAAIGIGSVTSTNCIGSEKNNWAGSINGFADGFDITNGIVSNTSLLKSSTISVPEPSTGLMFFSLVLLFFSIQLKRK